MTQHMKVVVPLGFLVLRSLHDLQQAMCGRCMEFLELRHAVVGLGNRSEWSEICCTAIERIEINVTLLEYTE